MSCKNKCQLKASRYNDNYTLGYCDGYHQGRADAIDEFSDLMMNKLPNDMDKMFACGEIALLICGVAEQLKEQTKNEKH